MNGLHLHRPNHILHSWLQHFCFWLMLPAIPSLLRSCTNKCDNYICTCLCTNVFHVSTTWQINVCMWYQALKLLMTVSDFQLLCAFSWKKGNQPLYWSQAAIKSY